MGLNMKCTTLLWTCSVLLQASFRISSTCSAFVIVQLQHQKPSVSFPALKVYTPEQEEDLKKKELEEERAAAAAASDQVLKSLTEKLDKSASSSSQQQPKKIVDNKAMSFLKKIGKVGGAANKDFSTAIGSDEGSGMAAAKKTESNASVNKKAQEAYKECTTSGVIDDMTESFPFTSSGTEWRGVSDRVRGGNSEGFITREEVDGRTANVLKGHVSLSSSSNDNNNDGTGFVQMVTDLPIDPSQTSVDASDYDGIEIDILSREGLQFNVHLRTPGSLQQMSYRNTVNLEVLFCWQTIRIPFSSFVGIGTDSPSTVDYSKLKRIGIVAIDQETDVFLAVGGVRFYSVI